MCRHLTDSAPYVFAWVGESDLASGRLTPRASGGQADGYLDEVEVSLGPETADGPATRAVQSGELQVADDLADVSASTFYQHHRVGVRKLLAAAFESGDDDTGTFG